jgi:hypothetical protein
MRLLGVEKVEELGMQHVSLFTTMSTNISLVLYLLI